MTLCMAAAGFLAKLAADLDSVRQGGVNSEMVMSVFG